MFGKVSSVHSVSGLLGLDLSRLAEKRSGDMLSVVANICRNASLE